MEESEVYITRKLNKKISSIIRQSEVAKKYLPPKASLTFAEFLSNKMLVIILIREGVPYSLFSVLQDYTPYSEKDWAEFLNISTKSLQRYKQSSKNFKPLQSEKIIEMSEVTNIGLDVFGDIDKFKLWLNTSNFALGKLTPMELLRDSYGKEMVIGELTKINHGILV
jgi:putative toxin-antitoxin system antitoxin component (TIGR02293 family)